MQNVECRTQNGRPGAVDSAGRPIIRKGFRVARASSPTRVDGMSLSDNSEMNAKNADHCRSRENWNPGMFRRRIIPAEAGIQECTEGASFQRKLESRIYWQPPIITRVKL